MPNYFTHLLFGAKVLKELSPEWAAQLRREREAFNLGCLGPDPLFFYRPALPNAARREALRMHKESALPVFRRLGWAIRLGVPQAESYAAGFLCHFALDAACHGFINDRVETGTLAHLAMEAELDRRLMENRGLVSAGRIYMPPIENPAVFTAAATAYEQANAEEVRKGYLSMRRDSLFFARCYGTRGGWLVGKVMGLIPACRALDGVILGAEPAPESEECGHRILELLDKEVPEAARRIAEFWNCVTRDRPLGIWFDRDFSGNPCRHVL